MLTQFRAVARTVAFAPPAIPFVSAVTGTPVTPAELCSPDYWTANIRETVRFGDCVDSLTTQARSTSRSSWTRPIRRAPAR